MATEPKTGLDFWPPGAMQPDLLFNALLYWLAVWAQPVVIAIEDDPPGAPAEGDTYIVGTGTAEWAGHDKELAYWSGQAWLFFAPLEGYEVRDLGTGDLLVFESGAWGVAPGGLSDAPIDGTGYVRKDGGWVAESAGGSDAYTIVNEISAFTAGPGTHDGLTTLTLAGGDVTFSDSEPYTEGMTFNIRATSPIELLEDSVTLDPPAGGTLELGAGMAVQVVFTGATTAVVIGQTVASP